MRPWKMRWLLFRRQIQGGWKNSHFVRAKLAVQLVGCGLGSRCNALSRITFNPVGAYACWFHWTSALEASEDGIKLVVAGSPFLLHVAIFWPGHPANKTCTMHLNLKDAWKLCTATTNTNCLWVTLPPPDIGNYSGPESMVSPVAELAASFEAPRAVESGVRPQEQLYKCESILISLNVAARRTAATNYMSCMHFQAMGVPRWLNQTQQYIYSKRLQYGCTYI